MLELIDSTIVNVAIPRMMGHLGVTLDEVTWVNTGYIVANVIVLAPHRVALPPARPWFRPCP